MSRAGALSLVEIRLLVAYALIVLLVGGGGLVAWRVLTRNARRLRRRRRRERNRTMRERWLNARLAPAPPNLP